VLYVSDTENHRIRRIEGVNGRGYVTCFAGQCGNGTSVYTETLDAAPPHPGYADGEGDVARFDTPKGIAVNFEGWLYVADTNNHLIRSITSNGTVYTVAGNLETAEVNEYGKPLEGCEPPCLKGMPGHRDGNLTFAQFYYPSDVAIGLNRTVVVTDQHRVRMITLPDAVSEVQGIYSSGRVVTLAGQRHEGERDGRGQEAEFNMPEAITMSLPDGIIYVADSVSCRVRRLMPADLIAEPVNCSTRFTDVIRPSGCQSYDPPVDKRDKTITPVFGNIHYNYLYRNRSSIIDGFEPMGRTIHDCIGSPPPDRLDKDFWFTNSSGNLVIDDDRVEVKEDTGDGTTIRVNCPASCLPAAPTDARVWGTDFYTDTSSICEAAIHAGVIDATQGGMVLITLQRGILSRNLTAGGPTLQNNVQSMQVPYEFARVVTLARYPLATVGVQTIAGFPAALLQEGCGKSDGQPAQEARFNKPRGINLYINASLNDSTKLYVADSQNHRIVAVSAVCSFTCENMGSCVGPDICECPSGWAGIDCSKPVCETACGARQVCVAPNTCSCIPGYAGYPKCQKPLCVQKCHHGGKCVAPDTCQCRMGWFDSNCTTPVCAQTCGNGANCTAPDRCSCPKDWSGDDCRIPTCRQRCLNGGWCTAPNTCTCPPQWSGHDCSLPVCMQGYMIANPTDRLGGRHPAPFRWETYLPCRFEDWCNATNGFDCRQLNRVAQPLEIRSGPYHRNVTGRPERPPQCTFIELENNAISSFPYTQSDDNLTRFARYTPLTPYEWDANPKKPWSAYDRPTYGKTQPWSWYLDRQVRGQPVPDSERPVLAISDPGSPMACQVALVEWRNVTQGPYVCANGGNCTAPDICQCAPGWIGFDCRTPVCNQGYYVPSKRTLCQSRCLTTTGTYVILLVQPKRAMSRERRLRTSWQSSPSSWATTATAWTGPTRTPTTRWCGSATSTRACWSASPRRRGTTNTCPSKGSKGATTARSGRGRSGRTSTPSSSTPTTGRGTWTP
jgi:hypothetical protein